MEKMVSVYSDADYLAVYKQKRKLWVIFCMATLAYLLYCVGWLVYHISLPYKDPMQNLAKAMVFVGTALYVILIFPYMAIKYSRVRRYYKLITYLSQGLKNEEKNYFYCLEEKSLQKDNIDVVGCVFETWNSKKCEWMDREAYFDVEKPMPNFESGDYVQYITQSNFIVQYRILQKQALEFEEVDDETVPARTDEQAPFAQDKQEVETESAEEKPAEEKPIEKQADEKSEQEE